MHSVNARVVMRSKCKSASGDACSVDKCTSGDVCKV